MKELFELEVVALSRNDGTTFAGRKAARVAGIHARK
jgi:hypothetical protein